MGISTNTATSAQPAPDTLTAQTVKAIRKALGLSQGEFGALLGITASHLSRIENGARPAGSALIRRIYDVLVDLLNQRKAAK